MILADSSIWIDHLRSGDPGFATALDAGLILVHPFVIGELALGSLRDRATFLALLREIPVAQIATPDELLSYIERHRLFSRGLGYVDAALLAATSLTRDARLWTRDHRLAEAAAMLGIGASIA